MVSHDTTYIRICYALISCYMISSLLFLILVDEGNVWIGGLQVRHGNHSALTFRATNMINIKYIFKSLNILNASSHI